MRSEEEIKITWGRFKKLKNKRYKEMGEGNESFVYGTRKGIKCEFLFVLFMPRDSSKSPKRKTRLKA